MMQQPEQRYDDEEIFWISGQAAVRAMAWAAGTVRAAAICPNLIITHPIMMALSVAPIEYTTHLNCIADN
jgi:hypothetical protein